MANKKINELSVRTPSLSDLMLVGDPSTGYSYKATISSLSTLLEANIALNDLSDVVITSVANGNLLAYNGTNWVNRTLGAYLGGTITQYVRGDGSLGDFSGSGGGGGASVSYYLNGSVNQGTFGGTTYYEMNKTPIAGAGTNFTINANGYIASFITDAGDPALLKIPGGNWNLEFYFSASSSGGTPSFYVELYKYDGTTFTLIASNSASPEGITNGTVKDAYFTPLSVPETVLTLTDRLAIRVYVTHSGRTITLHTENSNLCQIITTFTTGLTALNNLTAQVQFFATGTSGTDFAISSTTATHTFNLPTASGTNRGALSSADWTTFNGKVGGSGTTNYVSKFTASGTIGNSQIFDNGTSVGVNTASPSASYNLDVNGTVRVQGGELRLDNATTGTLNIYSATPTINFFSGGGYTFGRSGTTMTWNSANIAMQIGSNSAYTLDGSNGHVWRTGLSGGAALARLDTGGSLSIGNGSNVANASSILDLTSTTKGFLPPRMTSTQRTSISSPANGLVVYQSDGTTGLYQYNSSVWERLNSGARFANYIANHTGTTYADNTTYYFGAVPTTAATTQGNQRGIFNKTGTITSIYLFFRSLATPTNESITIDLFKAIGNGALSSIASTTFAWSGSATLGTLAWTGLNLSVSANDTYEFSVSVPSMATNPTNVFISANIMLEY